MTIGVSRSQLEDSDPLRLTPDDSGRLDHSGQLRLTLDDSKRLQIMLGTATFRSLFRNCQIAEKVESESSPNFCKLYPSLVHSRSILVVDPVYPFPLPNMQKLTGRALFASVVVINTGLFRREQKVKYNTITPIGWDQPLNTHTLFTTFNSTTSGLIPEPTTTTTATDVSVLHFVRWFLFPSTGFCHS